MQRGDNVIADIEARAAAYGPAAAAFAALQRTIETLGADVLRLAGELERAVELLKRHVVDTSSEPPCSVTPWCACCDTKTFLASLAAPPQPEPVKAGT
jgi:hypothetical protein